MIDYAKNFTQYMNYKVAKATLASISKMRFLFRHFIAYAI